MSKPISDTPPSITNNKTYLRHNACGFSTSQSQWQLKAVYVWKLKEQEIQFVRCPNCESDVAKNSLCKCSETKLPAVKLEK
jgi:hypothetical protein